MGVALFRIVNMIFGVPCVLDSWVPTFVLCVMVLGMWYSVVFQDVGFLFWPYSDLVRWVVKYKPTNSRAWGKIAGKYVERMVPPIIRAARRGLTVTTLWWGCMMIVYRAWDYIAPGKRFTAFSLYMFASITLACASVPVFLIETLLTCTFEVRSRVAGGGCG